MWHDTRMGAHDFVRGFGGLNGPFLHLRVHVTGGLHGGGEAGLRAAATFSWATSAVAAIKSWASSEMLWKAVPDRQVFLRVPCYVLSLGFGLVWFG